MPYVKRVVLFTLISGFSAGLFFVKADARAADAPFKEVSFKTPDGGTCYANRYEPTENAAHAVILAHGAVFNKESWHDLSSKIAAHGMVALPIDFRGYGKSKPGSKRGALEQDLLGAINYLKAQPGIQQISLIGGSMGGGAAGKAAVLSKPGDLHKLILLAASPISNPQYMKGDKLFIVSKGDRLHREVTTQYNRAKAPKRLEVLDGSAHAQHIFKTEQAEKLTRLILDALAGK
ncbi:MAG: alpha/beta fold hydrolase [Planctomycetota bacterium]|jgi:pimeloyl-ACP methyl ester carboxylesterase